MAATARWYGLRAAYDFIVYDPSSTTWNDVGGVYIFSKLIDGVWHPVYIGKCQSFRDRICSAHHKWWDVWLKGATHVHALREDDEWQRGAIEEDLLGALWTPCNEVFS